MAKKEKVYLATVDRFGYDLTVVGKTAWEAKSALLEEYRKQYIKINGTDPTEDEWDDDKSYQDLFLEDMDITEMELLKVVWL